MINYLYSIEHFINDRIIGTPFRWLKRWKDILVTLFIIVSVLFTSGYLGYRFYRRETQLVVLLVPTVIGALALFRWPQLGLVGIITSILIPINGPSNSNATMALVALLMGLWLLKMISNKQLTMTSSITVLPLSVFVLVAVLAFGMGQLPWYTFAQPAPMGGQLGGLSMFILSAAAFLLAANQIRDVRWLRAMVWTFLAIGIIYMAGRMAGRLMQPVERITSYFFNTQSTGSLFWIWLMALAFSQAVFNNKLHPVIRFVLGIFVMLLFYESYVKDSHWISGWLPPLFTVVAILGIRFWRVGIFLAPFAVLPVSRLVTYVISSDTYSYSSRVDAWEIVLEITKANPLLGLGPANYHAYAVLFPIRGYAVEFNSHSQYIDLIAQTGILGLVAFLWFFAAVGWVGWKLKDRLPQGFPRAYVYGALGGLVGTLVAGALGDWVIPFFYNITLGGFRTSVLGWLFLGGLVALEQIAGSSGNDHRSTT